MASPKRSVPDGKERAIAYIRRKILTCEFNAGVIIPVDRIAEELHLSKTPVRDALMELQRENYVEVIPRKATVVSHCSICELKELYEARMKIEISLLSAVEPVDIASYREELLVLREHWVAFSVDQEEPELFLSVMSEDLDFHCAIDKLSQNRYLKQYARELHQKSQRYWHLAYFINRPAKIQAEHLEILNALLKDDLSTAVNLLKQHIDSSYAVLEYLSE